MYLVWFTFLLIVVVSSVPINRLTANDILRIREKFIQETLSKPKYAAMKANMERRARAPPRAFDVPMNPKLLKRVKELEDSAKQDQNLRDMVTGPSLEETNRPIFDMLHQGDILLNDEQVRAIERAERSLEIRDQLKDGTVFGRQRIIAADPPFIAHKRNKRQILVSANHGYPKTKWDTNVSISYYFEMDIDNELKDKIREAVKFWQENSCLSFKENGTVEPKIRYFKGAGCFSSVGKQYREFEQDISLGNGCELFGVSAHETGHSLGLFHHQSRFDRDGFIDLVAANIPAQWMGQFNKVERDMATTLDVHYDYGSDLHYPGYDLRSSKVMLAAKKKAYQHTMGNRRQPTFLDLKLVNEFYECPAKCSTHPKCKNSGFVNPNNCNKCICPSGFAGDLCDKRASGAFGMPESCGKDIEATADWKTLEGESVAKGKLDKAGLTMRQAECHYHIKAPTGQQVEIRVESISGQCTNECLYGSTEIKFEDKQMTGARLCCPSHIRDIGGNLRTTDGLAIVSAYSQKETQKFKLRYRAVQTDELERGSGEGTDSSTSTRSTLSTSNSFTDTSETTLPPINSFSTPSTSSATQNGQLIEPTDQPIEPFEQRTTMETNFSPTPETQTLPQLSTTQTPLPTVRKTTTRRPSVVSTTSSCRDIAINCQFQLQYCRSAAMAMKTYCQYSCGFCDK